MQEPRPSVISHKPNGRVATEKPGIDCIAANGVHKIILGAVRTTYHRERMLWIHQPPHQQYEARTRICLPREDGTNAAARALAWWKLN